MAFEGLTEKLSNAFKKLRGKGRLSEADVKESMREIRLALLEADVNYKVVKDFIKKTTERCVGTDVLESLTPAQMIVKIVNEELTALMFERLPEAVRIGLEAIYSDADVVTGVEVTYTVNFSIYGINGTKDTTVYTVKYVVTGKAEFEYVEDSLKAIG